MNDCLFCKIAAGEIPSEKVYEDEYVYAFNDIDKKAPEHILIIPKEHVNSILDIDTNGDILNKMIRAAQKIAKDKHLDENGFRLVVNTGKDGGQTVNHLHIHLLGGRELGWPPG